MDLIKKLILENENPIIRVLRVGIFSGISVAIESSINELPQVDVTRDTTELIIVGVLTAILTGADKAWRNWKGSNV